MSQERVRFSYHPEHGYLCNKPGIQDGEYVKVPADSELPITEEWLREVGLSDGGMYRDVKWFRPTVDKFGVMCQATACAGPKCWNWGLFLNSVLVKADPSRGDLRRLAAALGIPLTNPEPKQ